MPYFLSTLSLIWIVDTIVIFSAHVFSILVPAPQHLTLERQLNKSVLIGWSMPDPPGCQLIESYHVYVDGVLKVTVKANERTRALVEGVDLNRVRTKWKIYYFFFCEILLTTFPNCVCASHTASSNKRAQRNTRSPNVTRCSLYHDYRQRYIALRTIGCTCQ